MEYPLISEYREAILSAEDNLNELSSLRPVLDSHGNPVMSSGNFAVVFKMKDENDGKYYAVKCFIKEQEGRDESYRKIADELEAVSSSYILPLRYLADELFVDSQQCNQDEFPVVVMEWVEGETLDAYINRNLDNKYGLEMLSYRFNRLSAWLLAQPFAHGDLKPDNILVRKDGSLALVDYDGMFVPSMEGEKAREIGSPNYRHPLRSDSDFNEHIDDFPIAVIALSLKAIALNPALRRDTYMQDRLLFDESEFRDLSVSKTNSDIQSMISDKDISLLYAAFMIALSRNSLDLVSFRLFMTDKPRKSDYEIERLSTEVSESDLAEGIPDEFGVLYSPDGKRLLKCKANLTNYTIKPGTKVIGDKAFSWCKSLQSINIPDSVTAIGNEAFSECKSLQSINIPDSVTAIGNNPFIACRSICIEVSPKSTYKVLDDFLIDSTGCIVSYFGKSRSVSIPSTASRIGNSAFYGCVSLWSIDIPDSVTAIEDWAFSWCESLQSINIPDSVTAIGDSAFSSCESLQSINIPDSVTAIGNSAFSWCESLQSIDIPDSVTTIGNEAFSGCESLQCINIPESVTAIGNNPFRGCPSICIEVSPKSKYKVLDDFLIDSTGCIVSYIGKSRNVSIPSTASRIGDLAFSGCKSLQSINIPDSVTAIGDDAFSECESLQSINIPDSVTAIGNDAFSWCESLQSINIPDSVTAIGNDAFSWCESLQSINIPDSVTAIGNDAFCGCKSLQSINIPDSVTAIGDYAFRGCESLQSINIPDSVTAIGDSAFYECESLQSINIPDSVTAIGNEAFSGCSSLQSINIPDSVTAIEDKAFYECESLQNINIPDSVTAIGDDAFYGCKSLLSINIPDSVTSIGCGAFCRCESIGYISLPKYIEFIKDDLFKGCESIETIIIPDSVKEIGNRAFASCSNLRELRLPNSLQYIGNCAFCKCISLISIIIPMDIKHIGKGCFFKCNILKSNFDSNKNIPNLLSETHECPLNKE